MWQLIFLTTKFFNTLSNYLTNQLGVWDSRPLVLFFQCLKGYISRLYCQDQTEVQLIGLLSKIKTLSSLCKETLGFIWFVLVSIAQQQLSHRMARGLFSSPSSILFINRPLRDQFWELWKTKAKNIPLGLNPKKMADKLSNSLFSC